MNACMHDYAKVYRKHGVIKSIMLEPRVNTPFGEDYGPNYTCITGSTKFPKFNPLRILLDDGTTPGPTTFVRKSRLSVASRVG